jgi:thiamine-monophosphate kinase
MGKLAKRFGVSLVGGDFSSGEKITVSVAVLGEVERKKTVFRTGAKAGDLICVTGELGGSILGKHLNFVPRLPEGQFLAASGVSAMIDVSDGLVQDLKHLIEGKNLGFIIDEKQIPVSKAAHKLAEGNKPRALTRASCDGEDFELLFTVSPAHFVTMKKLWPKKFQTKMSVIGSVTYSQKKQPLACLKGFRHF